MLNHIYAQTILVGFVVSLATFWFSSQGKAHIGPVEIQEVTITGSVQPDDQNTYRLEEFDVPEGIGALHVDFDYTGRYSHAEIEIGLFDPNGFRGTSRFSKSSFYISKYRTTPSYFPGPVPAGLWSVSLGFSAIRNGSEYEITIRMIPENHPEYYGSLTDSFNEEQGWYRGDFYTHTGHSDAFGCHDTMGQRSILLGQSHSA